MKARYAALLLFALVACREDPGTYDYSEHVEIVERNTVDFLDGPTPYVKGVPRLFLAQFFYEPAGSERIFPLNGRDINVFVFDTAGDGTGQFTLEPIPIESGDRIQGTRSTRIIHAGLTFWGFGVFWDTPHDISQYSTFNVSLKSTSPTKTTFDDMTISFLSGASSPSLTVEAQVNATDYGYANDDDWHTLTIPISDLEAQGWDPTSVRSPMILGGLAGDLGDAFLIDDVYYQ